VYFLDAYERIVFYNKLDDNREKTDPPYVSDEVYTNHIKKCRFCTKSEFETIFDSSSHAISEMVGNKWLYSKYECKICNHKFGEICEDSFGKYIFPFKIVSEVYGKHSKMTYKNAASEIRMRKASPILPEIDDSIKVLINDNFQDKILTMTPEGFDLNLKRQKYIPEWVYFSLLKMALSIIPYKLIPQYAYNFATLKIALDCEEERQHLFEKFTMFGFVEFIPGDIVFDGVSVEFFKRKNNIYETYPLCYFCLNFGHYSLQIPLPEDNQRDNKNLKVIPYSHFDNSVIQINKFNVVEEDFTISFSAEKLEFSKQEINWLEEILNKQ
jgi:hypothetical protein